MDAWKWIGMRRGCGVVIGAWACLWLTACASPGGRSAEGLEALPDRTGEVQIQALIDAAGEDAVVRVPAGRYVLARGLVVSGKKRFTLEFESPAAVLVTDTNADVLKIEKCEQVRVRGATLRHLKPLKEYNCHGAVIAAEKCDELIIDDCTLDGCGAIGASLRDCQHATVQRCAITHNSFNAICLTKCGEVNVFDCVIENNANFLQVYRVEELMLSGNVVRNNGGYWREPEPAGRREK